MCTGWLVAGEMAGPCEHASLAPHHLSCCWLLAFGLRLFLIPDVGLFPLQWPGVSRAPDCPHPSAHPARPEIGVIYYVVQHLMAALDEENAG